MLIYVGLFAVAAPCLSCRRLPAATCHYDRDVHGARDVVAVVLRADQLHRAVYGGVLRHRHVYGRRRHRGLAVSGTGRAFRHRRRGAGGGRRSGDVGVSGVYFVIFSLGLAELVRQFMTWGQHVLGTMSGIYVTIERSESRYYWQLLLLTAVVYLVGWRIGRSRLGFALRIIGNDEVVAVHCGINTARAKVVLFVISSTFASIAGAVVAPRWGYVEPVVAFNPNLSFQVVIMALLGGTHRLWGPLVGVIPFVLMWELISIEFPNQTTLLLGVSFLLIVYVIPNGFTGVIEDALKRRTKATGSAPSPVQRPVQPAPVPRKSQNA